MLIAPPQGGERAARHDLVPSPFNLLTLRLDALDGPREQRLPSLTNEAPSSTPAAFQAPVPANQVRETTRRRSPALMASAVPEMMQPTIL